MWITGIRALIIMRSYIVNVSINMFYFFIAPKHYPCEESI